MKKGIFVKKSYLENIVNTLDGNLSNLNKLKHYGLENTDINIEIWHFNELRNKVLEILDESKN